MTAPVPMFALYGEDVWPSDLDAIHVEPIASRSGMHNWEIRPHRHGDLHQIMWVRTGAGLLHLEGRELAFAAPRILALPPGAVHGFGWEPGSDGQVLMVTDALIQALAPAEDRDLLDAALDITPPEDLRRPLAVAFSGLQEEFWRSGAGRRAGLLAGVLQVVSLIARSAERASREAQAVSPQAELVARFRRLIEAGYREHAGLDDYCRRLGVTAARLSRACRTATGRSPLALIHERMMLEAKRSLTYTALSVSETAYTLGFSDPAYFSRFFQKREGRSPQDFRRGRGLA